MAIPRTYAATAGAFRRALEERLKSMSQTEQIDINRLRRQVSFDGLLARLFREDPAHPPISSRSLAAQRHVTRSFRDSVALATKKGSTAGEMFNLRTIALRTIL